jgi:hypothetical protein
MQLIRARVQNFKSISDSGVVSVDPKVTVFVGQNEAGKTAFLQALHKARAADGESGYDQTMDYPRRYLTDYEERHQGKPAPVATFTEGWPADSYRNGVCNPVTRQRVPAYLHSWILICVRFCTRLASAPTSHVGISTQPAAVERPSR